MCASAHNSAALAIFIPAYQAQRTIAELVNRIPPDVHDLVDVIHIRDDASTDSTWPIISALAKTDSKIAAVRNDRNLGFGGTNKVGFSWMRDNGIDAYIVIHGDLQYDPANTTRVLRPIVEGDADIVLGSRMIHKPLRHGMPLDRWLANKFLTRRLNAVLGLKLTDYHTGLVALRCAAIEPQAMDSYSNGHELTAELLVDAALNKRQIIEVSIDANYHSDARSCSRLTGVRYSINVLRLLARIRHAAFR